MEVHLDIGVVHLADTADVVGLRQRNLPWKMIDSSLAEPYDYQARFG